MKGYAYVAACCVTKYGVIGLTRELALETAKNGVVVVDAIYPGYTETALTAGAIENIAQKTSCFKDDACKILLRNSPQKRFIQPEVIEKYRNYLRYLQESGFSRSWK